MFLSSTFLLVVHAAVPDAVSSWAAERGDLQQISRKGGWYRDWRNEGSRRSNINEPNVLESSLWKARALRSSPRV